ncbi:HAMP domain-containing sensor histidine kinase [Aquabacterium sp.]|uniref:sensor histidine kinase n=1 Tax=Aquabacterium sp. TaxID=1872578 RepID=UPI0025BFD6AB|nr:HAMP domain-containing sensor histidine kinase [Aquabacterium sp.]
MNADPRLAGLPSIRARLSRVLMGIALVWGLMVSLTVGLMLHRALDTLLDQGLQESAEILYGLAQAGVHDGKAVNGMLPAPPHDEGLVWQLVGADGAVRLRSHRAPAEALSERLDVGFSQQALWRVYTLPLPQGQGRLLVAQPEPTRHLAQWMILGGSIGTALLVGLVSTLWLNNRLVRELAPLQDLSRAVADFNPLDPKAFGRLPAPARAELVPMAQAIDALGQRLAARVEHERAFAAHAAHALRTPLAGMDAQLAVALREAPASLQPRLTQTREAAARLRTVVTALISLFRAGGQMQWRPLDLSAVVTRLPVRGVRVQVEAPQPVWADEDLLSAALMNLLDNAARHRATEVMVLAEALPEGGSLIRVRDNGEGLSAERASAVNAALTARQAGEVLGLGLTLAELVARTHEGQVSLVSASSHALQAPGAEVLLRLGPPPGAPEGLTPSA